MSEGRTPDAARVFVMKLARDCRNTSDRCLINAKILEDAALLGTDASILEVAAAADGAGAECDELGISRSFS